MASTLCRWGILGTANIARKNWKAIRNVENSTLVAVASRTRERAAQYIAECQESAPHPSAPEPCGSYEELLARKDIDAVYIPLPTGVRKEWVLRAAATGKHVLCEKPCAVTSAEVREMVEACRAAKVQFMDGVMFMHGARLPLLRKTLDDGTTLGKPMRIASQFSFKGSEEFLAGNIRVNRDLEPLGCLGDLGWYNIRLSLWTMNEEVPERVTGHLLHAHPGSDVPLDFSGELFFKGGASASFYCSFRAENQQWATISGTNGYANLSDFVLPFFGCESTFEVNTPVFRVRGCDFHMESHPRKFAVHEYSDAEPNSQEANMIRTFAGIVLSGKTEPRWGEQALNTQRVLDACLASSRQGGKVITVGG